MNARVFAMPLIAAGIAVGIWLILPTKGASQVPAATWRIGTGTEYRHARNYEEVPAESPLRLSYSCTEPLHVYVFSHSEEDGTLLLSPSPDLKGSFPNPLPAGQSVLPGQVDDRELAWTTRAEILATTTYAIVAAEQPVAELEALLPHLRRWTNSVLPDKSMQVTNPPQGIERKGSPRTGWPSALLKRTAERSLSETLVNGPLHPDVRMPNVWISSVRIKESRSPK